MTNVFNSRSPFGQLGRTANIVHCPSLQKTMQRTKERICQIGRCFVMFSMLFKMRNIRIDHLLLFLLLLENGHNKSFSLIRNLLESTKLGQVFVVRSVFNVLCCLSDRSDRDQVHHWTLLIRSSKMLLL